MNFLKQRIWINLHVLITLTFFSCNQRETCVKSIMRGVEIKDGGYQFSDESLININRIYYSLREVANYASDGSIMELIVFKPEGQIIYKRGDLIVDKEILRSLDIPFHQRYYLKGDSIFDQDKAIVRVNIYDSIAISRGVLKTIFYKMRCASSDMI